jgi:hypothetical protein
MHGLRRLYFQNIIKNQNSDFGTQIQIPQNGNSEIPNCGIPIPQFGISSNVRCQIAKLIIISKGFPNAYYYCFLFVLKLVVLNLTSVSSITGIAGVSVVGNAHLEVIDFLSLTADGFEGAEYILYVYQRKAILCVFSNFIITVNLKKNEILRLHVRGPGEEKESNPALTTIL